MNRIPLGTQGLKISRLGLGCMGMSEFYGTTNELENIATLNRALDLGVSFWDTSDIYGPYTNEELLSKILSQRRDDIEIATKFGILRDADGGVALNSRPERVREACDASLQRLGVECIDLYYQHRVDPAVPIEETVGAMADLVKAGKVKYLGLSEATSEQLKRAHREAPISALQTEYSLWSREVEDDILQTTRDLGIGFVAYSPLGRGFLTGSITSRDELEADDWRLASPRFSGDNLEQNLAVAEHVKKIAAEKGISPAQLALAWVLNRGDNVTAIPGTKRIKYLEDNAGSIEVSFSAEELTRIDELFPQGVAAGTRY
ncbi:MAG: aryl-alcohol dehydrogenase-like predicted oxidoreductase [Halieaceae bacterium]|jgi:aryl-alcohol dehydrogenase-like predicted oxidoreductase